MMQISIWTAYGDALNLKKVLLKLKFLSSTNDTFASILTSIYWEGEPFDD